MIVEDDFLGLASIAECIKVCSRIWLPWQVAGELFSASTCLCVRVYDVARAGKADGRKQKTNLPNGNRKTRCEVECSPLSIVRSDEVSPVYLYHLLMAWATAGLSMIPLVLLIPI